jgi:DnaK suppressor protein
VTDRLRRDAEKVRPILPAYIFLIHHPQIGFMDQGSALERMVGAFAAQITLGQPMQLVIDKGHQSLQRLTIAITPVFEKLRYLVRQILSVAISSGFKIILRIPLPVSHNTPVGLSLAQPEGTPVMDKRHATKPDPQAGGYRRILLERRESVLTALGTKAGALMTGERISEEDQAQQSLSEAISLRLNGFEYLQLRQIQEALDRLALGEYGVCLACEQPIAPKRLKALPWAKYCVKCQDSVAEHPNGDDDRSSE